MSDQTQRNGDQFQVPMPPGAKPTEEYQDPAHKLTQAVFPDRLEAAQEYERRRSLPKPAPFWPYPVAVAGALVLGAVVGVNLPHAAPDSCLQALTQHQQQYDKLTEALPVAGQAIEAASVGSVRRLDAATADLKSIQVDLAKGRGPLDAATAECRGE